MGGPLRKVWVAVSIYLSWDNSERSRCPQPPLLKETRWWIQPQLGLSLLPLRETVLVKRAALELEGHFSAPGLPRRLSGKEYACQCRTLQSRGFDSWIGKIPWRRK